MFLFLGICSFSQAQYQIEKLDRGVVAVSIGGTKVFVSWRWLGDEDDISFNLYRNGTKVNATPLTVTNYTDNAGSTTASYAVKTVVNGVEQAISPSVTPWAKQFLKVPITAPDSMKTPDGVWAKYSAGDASIADLDGDGEWEIILKWDPSNAKDNSQSGYTGNTFIDAYKLDGTRLWRVDFGINIRSGAHYLDFMVYDFDGDGKAEMMARTADGTKDGTGVVIGSKTADYRTSGGYILSGPEYITVFNGETGKAMATRDLYPPRGTVSDWGDGYGNRVDRFKACVAYLDGKKPSAVFTRGYYAKWGAEALDWRNGQFTQRWSYMCANDNTAPCYEEGAHSLSVADVDNDGKQEVITGSLILDDNGTIYYNTAKGHGDALHVSDLDPDIAGIEVFHIQEPVGDAGVYMYSGKDKKIMWKKPSVAGSGEGPGRGVSADISATWRGAESWVIGGGISDSVMDCKGKFVGGAPKSGSAFTCNFLVWWDGDPLRELLTNTMIDKYGTGRILTAYNIAPIASNNGSKATPCLSGDIIGDWREEVIWRGSANDALYIFTTTTASTYKFRTLMSDPQYRVAIAWQNTGYNQPPHLSYYLGDGMATPAKPNLALVNPACLSTWYQDVDGDGVGDASVVKTGCSQPTGYVNVSGDECLTDSNKTKAGNCGCGKTETSCLDCFGVVNGKAVTDNCGRCVAGTTTQVACTGSIEAENACMYDGTVDNNNVGFLGTGFINTPNAIGSKIEFSVNASAAGIQSLGIRYALGGTVARGANVILNGVNVGTMTFAPTGTFTTYGTESINLNLVSGKNTLQIVSTTAAGLANVDLLYWTNKVVSAGNCIITSVDQSDINNALVVTPQPFNTSTTIHLSNGSIILSLSIVNTEGKEVFVNNAVNNSSIKIGESLPSGMYTVIIKTDKGNYSTKILKID